MMGLSTRVIHGRGGEAEHARPLVAPIYETTTFVFRNAQEIVEFNEGRSESYLYSRYGNPTVVAVERTLAVLDGADTALLFSSGMAAMLTTLMAHVRMGDEIVCGAAVYGGTFHLLQDALSGWGVTTRFVSAEQLARLDTVIGDRTKIVCVESPVNPTLRCIDLHRVAEVCQGRSVVSVVDNTFASPVNQRPLAMGIDLVVQSATKYLNGHSDVMAGVVAGSQTAMEPPARLRRLFGTVLDPAAAAALGRGLKTLTLRVARQNATGLQVAQYLASDARVAHVWYPGLPDNPDHAVAARQMAGFGGMLSFDADGRYGRAVDIFDRLQLVKRAASLGGVESLASLPVLTSHWGHTDAQLHEAGVTRGMIRLSVGLEDADDIIADLDQALG